MLLEQGVRERVLGAVKIVVKAKLARQQQQQYSFHVVVVEGEVSSV
jgi:hypothetical protein